MRQLCFIVIINYITAFGQADSIPLRFQNITTEQGLPHNYIHEITQDKYGFIWIGTNYGLVRYDGYNFKIFQPDFNNPHSITHKPIGSVYADSKNNLWLAINSGGINRMNLETERFKGYFHDFTKKLVIGSDIKEFYEDSAGTLWVGSNHGIFRYDEENDKFCNALVNSGLKLSYETPVKFVECLGNFWFRYENKIGILNKSSLKFLTIGQYLNNIALDTITFNCVETDKKHTIYLGTKNSGIIRVDGISRKINNILINEPNIQLIFIDHANTIYVVSNNPICNLFVSKTSAINNSDFSSFPLFKSNGKLDKMQAIEDCRNSVWIKSPYGLIEYNKKSGVKVIQKEFSINSAMEIKEITALFIDRTDNIWISPYKKGILKADLRQKPFNFHISKLLGSNYLTADNTVSTVFEDSNGNLWYSKSNYGISIYSKQFNKSFRYYVNSNDPVVSIYEDYNGNMWLGTSFDFTYKIGKPEIRNLSADNINYFSNVTKVDHKGVRKIVEDKNNLWLATNKGIVQFIKAKNKYVNITTLYDTLTTNEFFRTLILDKDPIIWAGSNNGGLIKIDINKKKVEHYLSDIGNKHGISSNTIYAIYQDKQGILWLGTGQGLEKFNPKSNVFEHLGVKNMLYKRSIFSVIPDSLGNLWMSTDNGIIQYKINEDKTASFGTEDGIQNFEFATTGSFINKKGEIFYCGPGGLISFLPSEIERNPIRSKPIITNILIKNKIISPGDSLNGRVLLKKQVWETNAISLFYYESDFTIEYSALHFSAPEKIEYQYKLEGFNSDWKVTDAKHRYASFTGLPPGNYTFVLRATNNDGLMCRPEDTVHLNITIIPPFWQTLWFKVLIIIIIFCLVILIIRYRLQKLRNKNIVLDRLVKERTYELENVNAFLEERTHELEEANTVLEERQEEINLQKEEIQTQYESLEHTNQLLQEHQTQILEQNIELDKHRNKLEFLVDERTRELEKALNKAEESDKLKTSFLTNMSHEIRTPMNAIIGFSNLLKEEGLEDKRDEFIGIIETNGTMLLTLINDILELSSLQAQQVSIKPMNHHLHNTLKNIYENFSIEVSRRNIKLILNTVLLEPDYHVTFDEVRFKQVFSNLISNAIKFTDNGTIEFGVQLVADFITFYVKDSGIGISNEIGNAIFDRFYKVENNTKHLYRGTGLGLAICKSIVTLWNGRIWYESELNAGTTFYFTLPANIISSHSESLLASNPEPYLNLFDKTILIAEDEESNYKLLENYLKKTRATLIWAKNGNEAINKVNEIPVSMVLLDIKMPQLNGIEAALEIKKTKPNLPIIALTAFAFKTDIEEIISSGVNAYMTKPIKKAELFELIKKYL